jgi:methanogenic corrinoid protein MtbC1
LLKDNGFKISKIAEMNDGEIQREVIKLTEKKLKYPDQIHALTIAMVDIDEERFEKIISTNILQIGFEKTMINIIYPFLSKIGVLWQTGSINPGQEHFVSNLIRQKLIVAIDGQYVSPNEHSKKFLLFLPEDELHELSLLFINYMARARQHKSVYLGQTMPFEDLTHIYDIHKPDYLLTVITSSPGTSHIETYINKLGKTFPESKIILTGYQVIGQGLEIPENTIILNRIDEIVDFIEEPSLIEA